MHAGFIHRLRARRGVVEALYLPSIPPASPYDAYLLMLVLPFLLRFVLLLPPVLDLIATYAPAGDRVRTVRWFWSMIRQLPIRGFWFLVGNEILAIFLPLIIAIYARFIFDPVGWPSWDAIPSWGMPTLLIVGFLWLACDAWRVLRTRERVVLLASQNLRVAKVAVAGLVKGRSFLDRLRRVEVPSPEDAPPAEYGELPVGNVGAAVSRLGQKVLDAKDAVGGKVVKGIADVADSALEGVRKVADRAVNTIDAKIDETVAKQTRAAIIALIRDVLMALGPILVLVALHQYA